MFAAHLLARENTGNGGGKLNIYNISVLFCCSFARAFLSSEVKEKRCEQAKAKKRSNLKSNAQKERDERQARA